MVNTIQMQAGENHPIEKEEVKVRERWKSEGSTEMGERENEWG
jgi:hypothetical protein